MPVSLFKKKKINKNNNNSRPRPDDYKYSVLVELDKRRYEIRETE